MAALRPIDENVQGKTALFVPEATRAEFAALSLADGDDHDEVGAVVLGDLGEAWDYATLNAAFRLLMLPSRSVLIALGTTRFWRARDGLHLDVAPFVVALQHTSGREPVVLGKPSRDFFDVALSMIECPREHTIMLGDDIHGDIGGAQAAGIDGVLV